jgi:hypothetical protein
MGNRMTPTEFWQQKPVLEEIVKLTKEALLQEADYPADVYVRTVVTSGFYGLLLEVAGEFRFDVRAIRALRNLVSERIRQRLKVEIPPKRIIVVFHDSSKRISENPATSLAEEMNRCRGLRRDVAARRHTGATALQQTQSRRQGGGDLHLSS